MFEGTRAFRAKPTEKTTFYPRLFGRRGAIASRTLAAPPWPASKCWRQGGTCADVACAAALVEGVVNPQMHTIGGELPILISEAPGSAGGGLHQRQHGGARDGPRHRPSAIVVITRFRRKAFWPPACRARWAPSWKRCPVSGACTSGTSPRRPPSWARNGFPAHAGLIRQHKSGIADNVEKFANWPGTAAIYLPEGRIPREGELLRNPALANMYAHLSKAEKECAGEREAGLRAVFDAFYRGDVAAEIVRFVKQQGGLLEESGFYPLRNSGRKQRAHLLWRRRHPQMRTLESGAGAAAIAVDPEEFRSSRPGTQFSRLYSYLAGGHEAGLRRSRAVLRRSASESQC